MKRRRRPAVEVEENEKAVETLDALDDLMRRITDATIAIDPGHFNKQGPKT